MSDILIYTFLLLFGSSLYLIFFPVAIGNTSEIRIAKLKSYFKSIKLSHALYIGLGLSLLVLSAHDLSVRLANFLGLHQWFWQQFPNVMSKFAEVIVDMLIAGLLASISFVILDFIIPTKYRTLI